ncbi:MAG TPA: alpha/beta hydrolase [Xanthobacteraceae bacterium]|nr:alpha/beta hydrolase [Xanthobacteraceae bacterium]
MTAAARPILRSSILAAGSGAPVLLLHGSASTSAMWTPVIDVLKAKFRVLAPDLIGYGRTDPWPNGHEFGLDDEVRLITPLLATQRSAHVVAHSYGGVVALELARMHRDLVRSLTLIEPVAFHVLRHASDPGPWSEAETLGRDYAAQIAAGETEAALRRFVDYWAQPGAWDAMDEGARAQMRRIAPKMVLDFAVVLPDRGPDAWRDVEPPARLLAGDKSPLPVRHIAAILARRLPSATLQVVAGANHLLPATHHRMLSEFLLDKLDD